MRQLKLILSTISLCTLLVSTNMATATPLPDLGSPSALTLPLNEEKKLGQQFMQALERQITIVHDPLVMTYINALGNTLTSHSNMGNQPFHFFVVSSGAINAFAGPYGYIGFNTGLIDTAHNEGELAAVMAHEIAHVKQRHLARNIAEMNNMRLPLIAAAIAAAALGAANPAAGAGVITAAVGGMQQEQLQFSRANEAEADRIGLKILRNSGFNPVSMPNFFHRMAQYDRFNGGNLPEYLRTHPLDSNRIADSLNRIKKPNTNPYRNSATFNLIKARLSVLTSTDLRATIGDYKQLLKTTARNEPQWFTYQYGYAYALVLANLYQEANHALNKLLRAAPDNRLFLLAQAELRLAQNQNKQALTILYHAYELYPDEYAVVIDLAKALLRSKQAKAAMRLLERHMQTYPQQPKSLLLLARSQAKAGQLARAYRTRAIYYMQRNNKTMARNQLTTALKYVKKDPDERDKIKAMLKML